MARPPRRRLWLWAVLILLLLAVCSGTYWAWVVSRQTDLYAAQAAEFVEPYRFDIARWEVGALYLEVLERIAVRPVDHTSQASAQRVRAYLETAREISAKRGEIERTVALSTNREQAYADVKPLEIEIERLRLRQARERPVVERVLERQVREALAEEQLGWLGQPFPPLAFQFTELPYYLVLSARDEIRLRLGLFLAPGLPVETREQLEAISEEELPNTSAIVEGIGGFSTWPTMILDGAGLDWILSTIAHEWVHTYLIAFPLGQRYFQDPTVPPINETVADLVGIEIGQRVYNRYYRSEAQPRPVTFLIWTEILPAPQPEAAPFDFVEQMRITRERVDELLARGDTADAEAYLEQRRLDFLDNGHFLRRLNQAFFALHGTYRTSFAAPVDDPVAPRLRQLLRDAPDIVTFLRTVRQIASLDDLMALVPEVRK